MICPECESSNVETKQEMGTFQYGNKTISVELPVRTCKNCELEYLDAEAEDIQENGVEGSLVGSVHLAGGAGPLYVVVAVRGDVAEIEFPESNEKGELPVAAVREDPLAR